MQELRAWLCETEDTPLEEMDSFFARRIDGYEKHMSAWRRAYAALPDFIPKGIKTLLDLGCGTGLELGPIFAAHPDLEVTGLDLSKAMLDRLHRKYPQVKTVCADYFRYPLGEKAYDAVISFESLHHFKPQQKADLFKNIRQALCPGGIFLNVDYMACCPQEEELLMETAARKRKRDKIPEEVFVHFDTPLTPEHEIALLSAAGFKGVKAIACIDGACFITAHILDGSFK